MTTVPKKTIEVSLETFRDQAAFPLLERAEETIRKAQQHLLGQQKPEGYWVGELFVDSTLISDVVTFMHWTGEVDFNKQSKCVKHLLDRQLPDGGWNIYYKGPSELNATLKAYFALKLAGFLPDDARMVKAPRDYRAARRYPQGEHLHEALSRHVRPVSVEASPHHSVGDHPAPQLALL